ncbi:nucleotidyl transferase AbiEii/AbiGii toxin family protein (plasmid) [Streptomyces sp. NBC_00015]|uniref:nucleotidyl transferase AbiEii/AbiGii toxin family protein n=1 Tax=Streptomyces sp. NBC_00015 TaxID=2903611 RepID=UPI00324A7BCA
MARETYTSPTAFYGALKHKAQLLARSEGLPVADVLSSYFFSRLVARVFHAQPDAWIVKGGHALLMRYAAAARLSQDIDIQSSTGGGIGEAVTDLLKAAAYDLDDYLSFTPARTSMHENGAAGAKQVFRVHMGTHEVGVVKVDVVTGHAPSAAPDVRRVTPLIDLAWPADWPEAKLYPIVNHLADKVCAMYERHKGSPSSRYRDLADILLISQREPVDGRYAQLALRTEARRRRLTATPGVDLELPQVFQPPGPAWPDRYPAAALQVPGLNGCATWNEAAAAAEAFLTPLLSPGPPGDWSAINASWQARPARPEQNSPQPTEGYAEQATAISEESRTRAAAASPPPQRPTGASQPVRPDVPPPAVGPGTTPGR